MIGGQHFKVHGETVHMMANDLKKSAADNEQSALDQLHRMISTQQESWFEEAAEDSREEFARVAKEVGYYSEKLNGDHVRANEVWNGAVHTMNHVRGIIRGG